MINDGFLGTSSFGSSSVGSSSGVGSSAPTTESVTPEVKKKYDELLAEIQRILASGPPKSAIPYDGSDSKRLQEALKELKSMQDQGVTKDMSNFLDFLFYGVASTGAQDFLIDPPNKIEALRDTSITISVLKDGKYVDVSMKLTNALQTVLDPNYDLDATQKLADMTLAFAHWGYDMYTSQLSKMKQQIELATAAINNLQALQEILNLIKIKIPDDFKLVPDNWKDVPKDPDVLAALMKNVEGMGNKDFWKDGIMPPDPKAEPKSMDAIKAYTHDHPSAYSKILEPYFKKEYGFTADFSPPNDFVSVAVRLLTARDKLKKLLDDMEAAAKPNAVDKSEGSPYNRIQKLLDIIDNSKDSTGQPLFPVGNSNFPYGDPPYNTNWSEKLKNLSPDKLAELQKNLTKYIEEGNKTNNILNPAISNAIQANQNLSSKMSDEIKAKNLTLQSFFDILNQVADALHKINLGSAQKISR